MIIRPALLHDSSKLYSLEQEIFTKANFPLSCASFYYHIKNNLLLVAELERNIVGYILVLIKRKKAKLYSLGVLPAFRGRGISNVLLQTALQELSSLGFLKVELEVRVDNASAISLYKSFGFQEIKILKEFYLDGCDALLMEFSFADKTL